MDRYATSLFRALQSVAPADWEISMPMPPAPPSGNSYVQMLNRLVRYPFWARTQSGDINHILDHSYAHLLYALDPRRTVVTVHDIAPLHFPGRGWGLSRLSWTVVWHALKRVLQIVAVSHFTASELHEYLQNDVVKIHVASNGVGEIFRRQPQVLTHQTRNQYKEFGEHLLLHVGHLHERKNFSRLIDALGLLHSQGLKVGLIQVGGKPNRQLSNLFASQQGLSNGICFLGHISDAELVALYSAVDVFVFPSLYEGFGMPVLEAMACGTPVVASNAASLPEVVGDAGILVDPRDANGLAEAICKVLTDAELREELRQRGLMRAKEFSWQRCAQATLAVYQEMIESISA